MNNLPSRRAFELSYSISISKGYLARTTAMDGSVGAAAKVELQRLNRSSSHLSDGSAFQIRALAREVVATWEKWRCAARVREWRWLLNCHMGSDRVKKGREDNKSLGELMLAGESLLA
jgi:hypothetical protein